ncbi:MAG: murein biosynthesis integral membrane protein MurJ [Alphaproteobacteria bacterium]|nr:murein biosynthesis integral membrane protein MurJ [Alphaproteobacteria bacterium]
MSVVRSAFTVGAFTLFSRFMGYARECIVAAVMGAGMHTDCFMVAAKLANIFRRIFAEGAFNASFLPRFSNVLHKDGKDSANKVLSDVFSCLLIILTIFVTMVLIFFPSVVQVAAKGFDVLSEKFGLTVRLGRICFPYLIFISLSSMCSGVLNTMNKFALPAALHCLPSVIVGISLIVCYFLGLDKDISVHIMAVFFLLAGILHTSLLVYAITRYTFRLRFNFHCWTPHVKDIMKNMIPGIIGAGVWQLNMLVDTSICSYLPTGAITCINLADRLNQFPLATLGIALSTALLPLMSNCLSTKDYKRAGEEMQKGLLFAYFLTFFAATMLISCNDLLVAVAFQRGLFGPEEVQITASALVGFALGLPFYVLAKVYAAVYFAARDTKTPVIFAAISVIVNLICLIILVPFFKYLGLSLCTSISAMINALLLVCFSGKKLRVNWSVSFFLKIGAQILAATITFFALRGFSSLLWTPDLGASMQKWPIFIAVFSFGCAVYLLSLMFLLLVTGQKNWKLWKKEAWV